MSLTPGQARFISDRYDASIRHADDLLKVFFERLERAGILDDTFVTLLSDHGEEFLEHGRIGHQGTLFIETLRVPWIIAGPGLAPRVVSEPVGLADVMPTLLALLGVPAPPTEGVSMLPVIDGRSPERRERPRFSEQGEGPDLQSAVLGDHHLIANARSKRLMLFDWRADPLERSDLIGSDPAREARLRAELSRHLDALAKAEIRTSVEPVSGLDEAQRARLRALGYED
jgi:arylsulfatase A-like enzyme